MQTAIPVNKENKTLDVCKALCCIIVTTAHLPSIWTDPLTEMYFNQWFLRFCVPFFFVSSGYFFYKARDKKKSIRRIAWLVALSYVLYLPPILEGTQDFAGVISRLRWNLVFGYEHLWYLSAALEGMIIWYVLEKIPVISKLFHKLGIPACVLLLLLGALLDEHYRLLSSSLLRAAGDFLAVFGGPRNVVFMGFPLLMFGGAMARYGETIRKIPVWLLLVLWVVIRGLGYWETGYLHQGLGFGFTNDLTFFGCWPALILFELSFRFQLPIPDSFAKLLRKLSEYVYVLHPLVAALLMRYLTLEPIPLWLATMAMCCAIYLLLEKQFVVKS